MTNESQNPERSRLRRSLEGHVLLDWREVMGVPINTFCLEDIHKYTKRVGDCLVWVKNKPSTTTGYAMMSIDGKSRLMHRYVFEMYNNTTLPSNICVLHKCDNRLCINPDHLFSGTKGDNNKDRARKNRSNVGEARPQHKLTNEQVIDIRNSAEMIRPLARMYGVNRNTIKNIKNGTAWRHLCK